MRIPLFCSKSKFTASMVSIMPWPKTEVLQKQSSVHYTGMDYGRASCVIDGNRAGYKSETAHVPNGWLEVILSEARCIESFAPSSTVNLIVVFVPIDS